ncbi:MAG TPA: 2-hydroxyacyl-CoA dehydratase family protein [Kineosporiaceae bacterium]
MPLTTPDRVFRLPEHVKPRLDASGPIVFSDRVVSTDEIWRFLTEEAPLRFPYAFDLSGNNIARISEDVEFVSGLKAAYLTLSLYDRIEAARAAGRPIVMIQGGQHFEPYFAAGAVPLRPAYIYVWARNANEGLGLRGSDVIGNDHLEAGRRRISVDACHQVGAHGILHEGVLRVDFVAPNLALRCSDMAYLTESHRSGTHGAELLLVDYPIGDAVDKPWAYQYVADNLRRLVTTIDARTGRRTTDDDLRAEIARHNRLRRLAREFQDAWQAAPIPPTNSIDRQNISLLGNEPSLDPTAVISVLDSAITEVKARAASGVRGHGLAADPVRLFVCGSCVTADPNVVDGAGGVVVGKDDGWSETVTDAAEDGDPYLGLATQTLSWPYEQGSQARAVWTAEQTRRTRSDGLLFIYQWGCNFQSAVARLIADSVKAETGLPTAYLSSSELGKSESLEQHRTRVEAFVEMLRARKGVL